MRKNFSKKSTKGFGATGLSAYRQFQRDIAAHIAKHGRCVLAICANGELQAAEEDERNHPAEFTYTIGNSMQESPFPELLTFYPSNPTNRFLLNSLSNAFRDGEIDLKPGEAKEFTGFLGEEGCIPVRLRYLNRAEQAYSNTKYTRQLSPDAPVVLVEPPTPAGHFADDPDCDRSVRRWYEEKDLRITSEMVTR